MEILHLPLEIQHPKDESSRLRFIESVHERKWQMRHTSRRQAPGGALLCSRKGCESDSPKGPENVNITTLNRCTGRLLRAATQPNDRSCDL